MKLRALILIIILASLSLASTVALLRHTPPDPQKQSPSAGQEAIAPPHPLTIEAMRTRSYPGGEIKTEEDLGAKAGYRSYVVSYPSDGLKIYALMNVPITTKPSGGYPVLIFNHGYIAPEQYNTAGPAYAGMVDFFSRNGYLVFKPDYRGHGKSEGVAEGGHASPAYTYDVLNAVTSIKRHPDANPDKLGMFGHSMGGHLALRSLVINHDIKAFVIMAGVVGSAEDLFYRWKPDQEAPAQSPAVRQGQRLIDTLGEPKSNPDFWYKFSAINYVDSATAPVQLHHGTADPTVPKLFSDNLHQALQGRNKPVEYHVYEGGDHNLSGTHYEPLLRRSLDFLNVNLK